MHAATIRSICLIVLLLSGSTAFAQNQHLVGRKVMTIEWYTEFIDGTTVTYKSELGKVYEVDRVNGKWLMLVGEGRKGWVKRSDVVPYEEAIDHFTRLIRQDPSGTNYYQRAIAWKAKGELDIALFDYNESIRRDPSAAVYSARGVVLNDKGEYDRAIADYNEAIRLKSGDASYYNNRGKSWKGKKEYDKAIADFSEAIRLDPKDAIAYYNRGTTWNAKKMHDKAIADYNEAIRLAPKHVLAHNNRGNSWLAKKQYDKAIADFSEAIRLSPTYAHAYNNLAWLLATCPDAKYSNGLKAVEHATTACELGGWKDDSHLGTLSAAYAAKGDFDEAEKWLEKAIELNPDANEDVRNKMMAAYEVGKPYREESKDE
jgi:tetratricopeptide (TPR) repeat protein